MPRCSFAKKPETRITPGEAPPKFYAEHLKPYEFISGRCAGRKVLDVACGDGYGSAHLAKSAQRVIAIDYEEDIILRAQNKYRAGNLSFMCMDAAELRFADSSFDIVCSFQAIEHMPEDKLPRYLSEIKRVLRVGGTFYLSTLNLGHARKSPLAYKSNPAHCREFALDELRDLLEGVFPRVEIYGLHLTLKHRFYQRLKKIGIFNPLPAAFNPVKRYYSRITTGDFIISQRNLRRTIDFICVISLDNQ